MCSWEGLSICALVWDIWILLCDSIGSEGSRESSIIQIGRWIPEIAPCLQSVTNSSGSVTLTELRCAERTAEHIQITSFYFDIAFVPTQMCTNSRFQFRAATAWFQRKYIHSRSCRSHGQHTECINSIQYVLVLICVSVGVLVFRWRVTRCTDGGLRHRPTQSWSEVKDVCLLLFKEHIIQTDWRAYAGALTSCRHSL